MLGKLLRLHDQDLAHVIQVFFQSLLVLDQSFDFGHLLLIESS